MSSSSPNSCQDLKKKQINQANLTDDDFHSPTTGCETNSLFNKKGDMICGQRLLTTKKMGALGNDERDR